MQNANTAITAWQENHPLLAAIARRRRVIFLAVLLLSGLLIFSKGVELSSWRSPQIELYNQAMAAYENGDLDSAVKLFDSSIAAYEQELAEQDVIHNLIYGTPSRELAALANFQKGKSLLLMKKVRPAIEAFMESLRLNPGDDYTALGVKTEDVQRMFDQALIVKYDLELLFRANQSQAQESDQGQPAQPADKGDKPVPGSPQSGPPGGSGQGDGGGDDL